MVQILDDLTEHQMYILERSLDTSIRELSLATANAATTATKIDFARELVEASDLLTLISNYRKLKMKGDEA